MTQKEPEPVKETPKSDQEEKNTAFGKTQQ